MPLSWNEIKTRAAAFSAEWKNEVSEDAEAKSFWDDFFNVFGISRRRVASFEQKVKKLNARTGFIDLLWKGTLLIEHKSRGENLDKAYEQAKNYFPGLKEAELPRYILVSDFARFRLYDLEQNTDHSFTLDKLLDNVHLFGFIAGYQKRVYKEQDPVNIEAAERMGRLHDALSQSGYEGHTLEIYLVRLVFLLFADDTSIFEKGIFFDYLNDHTKEDGSDLAGHLALLFQVLNTPPPQRMRNLDEALAAFPYVNGKLFEEPLMMPSFDGAMRRLLLDACALDWGRISPAIFGSLFQSVMDAGKRRNLGAHYTSEKNILKLIKPLFLDGLRADFDKAKNSKLALQKLHDRIAGLRFLDPACGCGNFLIIAYRELRLLEIDIIKSLLRLQGIREDVLRSARMDASYLVKCNVDQFYGIEYEEFPAQIARTALWLVDHQMNMLVTDTFGEYYARLPLRKSATIYHGNALSFDWDILIEDEPFEGKEDGFNYILGNPPFIGSKLLNERQRLDMKIVAGHLKNFGTLDYVAGWYIKAVELISKHKSEVAFVSTNSIVQGEQVVCLWPQLLKNGIEISFAHQTFQWSNEAKGVAAVHCVIVGLAILPKHKKLFTYSLKKGDPTELTVANVNSYLSEGSNVLALPFSKSICGAPTVLNGSIPADGGNLILNVDEKTSLVNRYQISEKWIRQYMGAEDFLNNQIRFCLWLKNCVPSELNAVPEIVGRLQAVRLMRLKSAKPATREKASLPSLFTEDRQPENGIFLAIPRTSSEARTYFPIGFLSTNIIAANDLQMVVGAQPYHFGVLSSKMHLVWVKVTAGIMKSDLRYSVKLCYNNFPWPENPTEKQKQSVENAAQAVLDARANHPNDSLADLYDPNTMPADLVRAHQALDKAVDLCYRPQPFASETKRIEFLFELYEQYTAGMFVADKKGKKKKEKTTE